MELSKITPLLASHNVRNIGIGLERLGLQDFIDGQYFNGDLYIDVEKKTYKDLGYKRFGWIGIICSLFSKTARKAIAQNKVDKLKHDRRGDGLQNGGTLIIAKGGTKVLLNYRQENPADRVENSEILKALGIPISSETPEGH